MLFGLLVLVAAVDLAVTTDSRCPSADAVAAELAPLLPRRTVAATPDALASAAERAEISVTGTGWSVTLRGRDGIVRQREQVAPGLRCPDAARELAVILAAWEFQGRSALPATPPPVRVTPAPPPEGAVAVRVGPVSVPVSDPLRFGVGGGVAGVVAGGGAAPAVLGELVAGHRTGAGLRVAASVTGAQTLTVGEGTTHWSRATVGLGGLYAARGERYGLSVRGDVLAAWWSLSGEGFTSNRRGAQRVLGAEASLRGTRALGPAEGWVEAGVTVWPGTHSLEVAGTSVSRTLPTTEVSFRAGVDFFLGE